MIKPTLLLMCVLLAPLNDAAAANNPADEKALMATLEAMAKATMAKDIPTLAVVYGDDLTYSHSASNTQTKVVSLNFMNTDTFGPGADFSTSAFVWVFDAEWL